MPKDNDFFENIKVVLQDSGKINSQILNLLSNISFSRISEDVRTVYQRSSLIKWLLIMKLLGVSSICDSVKGEWSDILKFKKDVLYKIKNSESINWRSLLLQQSWLSMKGVTLENSSKDITQTPCFIIDDTDLPKRGKCMEMIGRIFSHVTHRYELGYKSLNLSFWSGKHLLHLDFSIHVELGKNNNQGMKAKELKNRYAKQRKDNSAGQKRVQELIKKKTDSAISMIRRAINKGFKARYILADSWFFNTALAKFAIDQKVHLISRPKFNNWKYEYEDKLYTVGELVKKLRYSKKAKWNRHLRLRFISVKVKFKGMDMKLFLYKEKKRGTKWHAIITTDLTLSAQKTFKIYQTRWTIESSYKELKQILKLGKCMSRDFDAQISDATQCLMCYNILSHMKAINDHQSIGALFNQVSQQWLKPTLMNKFWEQLYEALKHLAEIIAKPIDEIIQLLVSNSKFISNLKKINSILTTET